MLCRMGTKIKKSKKSLDKPKKAYENGFHKKRVGKPLSLTLIHHPRKGTHAGMILFFSPACLRKPDSFP